MWVTFAAGYQAVYQSLIIVLAGVVLYACVNGRSSRTAVAAPADVTSSVSTEEATS
jgi:basic amino acid/polyamine antiporter, APA family